MSYGSNQFYVTLPSNASLKTFPENTVTQYTTLLPQRMELEGDWEVGLTEFSYPVSWYNIGKGEFFQIIANSTGNYSVMSLVTRLNGKKELERRDETMTADIGEGRMNISDGHYGSAKELLDEMKSVWTEYWVGEKNELLQSKVIILPLSEKHRVPGATRLSYVERATLARDDEEIVPSIEPNSLRFDFNEKTHRAKFTLTSMKHELVLTEKLSDILAVRKRNGLRYESEAEVDVNRARHTIFVYSDVVADSIVGDVRAPLLRSAIVRGSYGENVRETFAKVMYLPVKSNHFQTIRVSIKTETGDLVPFNYGNSCVVLHFRRVAKSITF